MLHLIWIRQTNKCRFSWTMWVCVFDTLTDSCNSSKFISFVFFFFVEIISTDSKHWNCHSTQLFHWWFAGQNLRLFIIDNAKWTYYEPNEIQLAFSSAVLNLLKMSLLPQKFHLYCAKHTYLPDDGEKKECRIKVPWPKFISILKLNLNTHCAVHRECSNSTRQQANVR